MAQTSYSRSPSASAFAGQLGDSGEHRIESWVADQGTDLPAGVAVTVKSEGKADLPAGLTEKLAGISLNSFARSPDDLTGTAAIKDGATFDVLTEGAVWVVVEEAMAVTDNVYVRTAANTGTQLGAFRNDADPAAGPVDTCRRVKGARVLIGSSGSGVALIYFSAAVDASHL